MPLNLSPVFYFNQVNEIASKRLRALAKYLPQFGWEPIVIVPDLGFIPKENDDLNCRIIYTEYEDMFSHFSNKFKKSESKFPEDSKDSIEFNDEKLKDSTSYSNPIASKAISIAGEVFAYPDGMKYWHESAFEEASKLIEEEEIDAIISSSWPITCHTIAKDLKEHHDIPWIADLRDLWNLNPYVSHTFIRDYFEKRLEFLISIPLTSKYKLSQNILVSSFKYGAIFLYISKLKAFLFLLNVFG